MGVIYASNDATRTEMPVSVPVAEVASLETQIAFLERTIARLQRKERKLLRNIAALEVAIAAMSRKVRTGGQ